MYCCLVLMVDGTFLKGKHKGVLLSAVARMAMKVYHIRTNNSYQHTTMYLLDQ